MLATIGILFAGCCKDKDNTTQYAQVKVRLNGFAITQEDFPTKSTEDPADYNLVKAIDLVMFASDGSEAYRHTQLKDDGSTFTTFGEFSFTVPVGNYTLVAVARQVGNGDVFSLTSPTEAAYTSEKPRETFCATQSVTVTNTTPLDLSVTLNRISSWLTVLSTDGRPASATKVRTTFEKGGKSFNPTTGLALTDAGFSQVGNPSTAVGATVSVTSLPFLYADEETMDVTIDVLDADDNVLFTHTVEDVPFQRNRKTILRGAIFTAAASAASFQLETGWLDDETIDF